MKADQERVKNLLTDTVSLLCKNGLTFQDELKVQAIIGISVDSEVFIVQVDKSYKNPDRVSPDVQATDEPPQNENRSPRQRQRQAQPPPRRGDVVDLTGPSRNGQAARNRTMGNSRMSPQNVTPTRRMNMSPRTPVQSPGANQRFRSPMQGSARRYMSPQSPMMAQRGYSPRQQYIQSPGARRSLSTAMNNQRMAFQPQMTSPQRQRLPPPQPLPTAPPPPVANKDVVIVLDDPNRNTPPTTTTPVETTPTIGRVLGTIATAPTDPITIQPDEPTVSAADTSDTPDTPETAAKSPPATNTSTGEKPTTEPTPTSPPLETPLAPLDDLTTPEDHSDDPLSKLASELADKQHKRATEPDPVTSEGDKESTDSPVPKSENPPGTLTITPSSPESGSEAPTASTTAEPVASTSTADPSSERESDSASPSLSVHSVQGNFVSYEQMDTFRVLKKPPDEPSEDEPPAKKKRAATPEKNTDDETPTVKTEGEQAKKAECEKVKEKEKKKKEEKVKDNEKKEVEEKKVKEKEEKEDDQSDLEVLVVESDLPQIAEMKKKSPVVKIDAQQSVTGWRVREMLERHIVTPVLKKQEASVLAFRVSWRGDSSNLQDVWDNLALKRTELDDEVVKPLGISFFLSTVTVESLPAATYPAIGYWVVSRHPDFDKDELVKQVKERSGGGEVQRLLKVEGGTTDEYGAICQLVKDVCDPEVQQKLKQSAESGYPSSKVSRPMMARFVLKENFFEHLLKIAVKNLRSVSFMAGLDKVV